MLAWLSVWSKLQTCIWPSWCHCLSLSLASVKSRLVLPFWYRLTWVVPEKGRLNVWILHTIVLVSQTHYVYICAQIIITTSGHRKDGEKTAPWHNLTVTSEAMLRDSWWWRGLAIAPCHAVDNARENPLCLPVKEALYTMYLSRHYVIYYGSSSPCESALKRHLHWYSHFCSFSHFLWHPAWKWNRPILEEVEKELNK